MKLFVITFFLSIILSACGGYNTGVLQKSDQGFLKFSGNTFGMSISLDDGEPFTKDEKVDLIKLKPGKHNLKVFRNGTVVVNRIIIVENQNTVEIEVP
jgi:hypothetical protein